MVRHLLDKGVDPNRVWDTNRKRLPLPIHSATFMGHLDIVKMLLEAGSVSDAKDGSGNTPLNFALHKKKRGERLKALKSGIDISGIEDKLNELRPRPDDPYDKPWDEIIELLKIRD